MSYPKLRFRVVIAAILVLITVFLTNPVIDANIQEPSPKAEQVLSIDDGVADDGVGGSGNPGFGWFNLLKPDNYPATLTEVQVAFNNSTRGVPVGSPVRIVVFIDPEENGPEPGQRPNLVFSVTVNNPGSYERYTMPETVTIESGAFFVGVLDSVFVAELPAFIDLPGTVKPAGSRSFFTIDNGGTFFRVDENFPAFGLEAGSWMIRGVAEVADLPPIINRAFYRKGKLRIIGRNFANEPTIRINGKRVDVNANFMRDAGKYVIKGTPEELNLNPVGQANRLVVVIDGIASAVFEFTT